MSGHTIGNLLLTALADITGDFEAGIEELCEMSTSAENSSP